jgi:flagellar protein FlaG
MENKLSVVAAAPDVEPVQAPVRPVVSQPARAPKTAPTPEPDLRLVIEEGQAGSFVYKTIDRRTGEVILQLPREEVLRMRDTDAYSAGAVIATQA